MRIYGIQNNNQYKKYNKPNFGNVILGKRGAQFLAQMSTEEVQQYLTCIERVGKKKLNLREILKYDEQNPYWQRIADDYFRKIGQEQTEDYKLTFNFDSSLYKLFYDSNGGISQYSKSYTQMARAGRNTIKELLAMDVYSEIHAIVQSYVSFGFYDIKKGTNNKILRYIAESVMAIPEKSNTAPDYGKYIKEWKPYEKTNDFEGCYHESNPPEIDIKGDWQVIGDNYLLCPTEQKLEKVIRKIFKRFQWDKQAALLELKEGKSSINKNSLIPNSANNDEIRTMNNVRLIQNYFCRMGENN